MPVIYRPPKSWWPSNPTRDWEQQAQRNIPLDWDENRMEVRDAPRDRGRAAAAICTFVIKSRLSGPRAGNYTVSSTKTVEEMMRETVTSGVVERQRDLMNMFDFPDKTARDAARKELEALDEWPKADVEVVSKFRTQLTLGMGTGFAIGGALVVTAGHCTKAPNPITSYYAVFGLTQEMVNANRIPEENVFETKRIVHRVVAADYDPVERNTPVPWGGGVNWDDWTRSAQIYDCAIIELKERARAVLSLSRVPPAPGTPVFTIGSPTGMSLKYAQGGAVLKAVDIPKSGVTPADQLKGTPITVQPGEFATFTADIDIFKGNSGGPLMTPGQNIAIGIVKSGAIYPFVDYGSQSSNDSQSLNKGLYEWIRRQTLNAATKAKLQAAKFPVTAKDRLGLRALDDTWRYGYTQLLLSKDNKKVGWQRFLADSLLIANLNRFTRVDGLSYFAQSLTEFQAPTAPNTPHGTVWLTVEVKLSSAGTRIDSDLGIKIYSSGATVDADVLKSGRASGWNPGEILTWNLTTTDVQAAARTGPGNLPHQLRQWTHGMCELTSVELVRVKNKWDHLQATPQEGTIFVQFDREADTANPRRWEAETFLYTVKLKFSLAAGDQSWKAPIGGLVQDGFPWEGPRAAGKVAGWPKKPDPKVVVADISRSVRKTGNRPVAGPNVRNVRAR